MQYSWLTENLRPNQAPLSCFFFILLLFLFSFLCHASSHHDHLVGTRRSIKYHLGMVTITEGQTVVLCLRAYIRVYYIFSNYLFGPTEFIQKL